MKVLTNSIIPERDVCQNASLNSFSPLQQVLCMKLIELFLMKAKVPALEFEFDYGFMGL